VAHTNCGTNCGGVRTGIIAAQNFGMENGSQNRTYNELFLQLAQPMINVAIPSKKIHKENPPATSAY